MSSFSKIRTMATSLRRQSLRLAIAGLLFGASSAAQAQTLYWDTNGATAGTTAAATGNWSTTGGLWSTDATGSIATGNWVDGRPAVFSAGTNGTSAATVTLTSAITASTLTFEEPTAAAFTITGGTNILTLTGAGNNLITSGTSSSARVISLNTIIAGTAGLGITAPGNLSASGGADGSYLRLGGVNTFTGNVTINEGLVFGVANTAWGAAANTITLNGGGIVDPNANVAMSRSIIIGTSGGTFRIYGSVSPTWTSPISGGGNINKTDGGGLTLTGSFSGYSGTYNNQAGTTSFTSANAPLLSTATGGTMNFSGASTPTLVTTAGGTVNFSSTSTPATSTTTSGTTNFNGTANAGTVNVNGGTVNFTSTGLASTINATTGILNLNGTATAPTVLNASGSTINLGANATTYRNIGLTSLTHTGGAINFDAGTIGNDAFTLTGNYGYLGGSLNVAFNSAPNPTTTLITAASVVGGAPTINLTGLTGSRFVATPVVTSTSIAISTTGAVAPLVWKGNVDANWATPLNYTNVGSPDTFFVYDSVTLDDTATSFAPVIAANVNPTAITFNNTTAYTVTGAGGFIGVGSLTKSNTGSVVLRTPNTYTGATTVSAGTLEIDHDGGSLTGTSGVAVAAGATLALTRDNGSFLFNRNISGAGTVNINPITTTGTTAVETGLSGTNTGFTGKINLLSPTAGTGSYRTGSTATGAAQIAQANVGTATIEVDPRAQLWGTGAFTNNFIIAGMGYAEAGGGTVDASLTALAPSLSYGGIGALRFDTSATHSGNITLDGPAKIMSFNNTTATFTGTITNTNPTDILVFGGGTTNSTAVLTGDNSGLEQIWVNSGSGTSNVTHTLQVGNNGTTGTLGTGNVTLHGDSAATAVLRFSRSNGYTLAPGQNILADVTGTTSADFARTSVDVRTTGTGLDIGGNTIDLSDGTNGGFIGLGNIPNVVFTQGAGSLVDVGTMNLGEGVNNNSTYNQNGGTTNVIQRILVGHWSTETSTYNITAGNLNLTAVSTTATPSGGGEIGTGGIYLGIDGRGILNQSGGTVATNWVVLDNRGDTGVGTNMTSALDQYNLSGGTLNLRSNHGIIQRNSGELNISGGTIRIDNTGTGTNSGATFLAANRVALDTTINVTNTTGVLDTAIAAQSFSLTRNVTGTGTLTTAGGGLIDLNPGTGTQTVSAIIAGVNPVQKSGTGTTTLSSISTYSGATTVTAGTLNLTGSINNSALTVNDSQTLNGEGSAASIALTTTAGGTSTLITDPNTAGAMTAVGALTVPGTTSVSLSATPLSYGPFKVLNFGTTTATPTNFTLANLGNYRGATFAVNANDVTLNVQNKDLVYSGATSTWEIGGSDLDWNTGADNFFYGDGVTFDDSQALNTNISLVGSIQPSKVIVSSNTNAYTLNTSASNLIAGPTGLLKQGTSTLTMAGTVANTFTGGTTISAGQINIQNAGSLGTGPITLGDANTLANNVALYLDTNRSTVALPITIANQGTGTATLGSLSSVTGLGDNNQFTNITLAKNVIFDSNAADRTDYENITGTGNITITGSGRSIFITPNTFVGNVTVAPSGIGGHLQLGTGSGAADFIPNASNVTVTNLSGNSVAELRLSSASETINALNGDGTIDSNAANAVLTVGALDGSGNFTGDVQPGTNFVSLIKAGTGTQTFTNPANVLGAGSITVNAGTLTFAGSTTPGTGVGGAAQRATGGTYPSITVNGGTLNYQARLETTGNGGGLSVNAGTLNVTNGGAILYGDPGIATTAPIGFSGGTGTVVVDGVGSAVFLGFDGLSIARGTNSVGVLTISNQGTFTVAGSGGGATLGDGTGAAGTLNLASGGAFVSNRNLSKGAGTGTVNFDGGIYRSTATASVDATVVINATANGLTTDVTTGNLTINPVINGVAGTVLTKTGTGTLVLPVANTYGGGTALNGGAISIGNVGALGTGALTVDIAAASGTGAPFLTVTQTGSQVLANNIVLPAESGPTSRAIVIPAGAGNGVQFSGVISGGSVDTTLFLNTSTGGDFAGLYRLSGTNTFLGNVRLNRGSLQVDSDAAFGPAGKTFTWDSNSNSSLIFTNPMTFTHNVDRVFAGPLFNIDTLSNTVTMSGNIGSSNSSTNTGFNKVGTGTLILSGNNSYVGPNTISAGTLLAGSTSALGSVNNNLTVLAGSTMDMNGNSLDMGALIGAGTVANNAPSTAALLTLGNGDVSGTFTGTILNNTGTGGTLGITKIGTGTQSLNGANNYTGPTTVNNGRLNINGTIGTLTVADGTTIGGEATATTIDLGSGGTITLGVNAATSGALTSTGTLNLPGNATVNIDTLPVAPGLITILNFGSSAVVDTQFSLGTPGPSSFRTSTFTVNPTNVTLDIGQKNLTWTGTTTNWEAIGDFDWNAGADQFYTGDAVTFNDTGTITAISLVGVLQPGLVTVNSATNAYTLTSSAGNTLAGSMALVKQGTSILTMAGVANTYIGGTTISNGGINVRVAGVLGTGTVTLGDTNTGTSNVELFIDTNRVVFTNPVVISNQGTGTATIGSRATVTGSGAFGYTNVALNRNLIISSNATDRTDYNNLTGTGNITVTGSGRTVFTGSPNTFLGNVMVAPSGIGGTLQIGVATGSNTDLLPDSGNLTVTNLTGNTLAELRLSSTGESVNGLFGDGTIDTNSVTGTLTVGANGGSGTFSGQMTSAAGSNRLSFAKNGSGTQILSGGSNYSGATTVNGGVLKITGGIYQGAFFAAPAVLTVNAGAKLELENWHYDQTATVLGTFASSLGGLRANADAIVVNGGTISVVGTATTTYGRGITVNAGGATLETGAGANWVLDDVTNTTAWVYNGNPSLTFTGAGSGSFAKVYSGSGALTKSGTGSWTLSGANTYSGGTTVSAGTLLVNNTTGSGTGTGAVNVSALATLGGTGTISGLTTVASTGVLSPNTTGTIGTLTLNGGLTTTGASLVFDLGTPMSSDKLDLGATGVLTTTGGLNAFTFAGTPSAGTYTLIDYGTFSGVLADFTAPAMVNGLNATLINDTGIGAIVLTLAPAGPDQWIGTGNWTTTANWQGAVPNSATAVASFLGMGTGAVTVDAPQTVNQIVFNAATPSYTIGGSSVLSVAGTTPSITNTTGSNTITAPLNLANGTAINVTAGSLAISPTTANTVGTGVTATVNSMATLTLGGTANALNSTTNIANAGTLTVSGTAQTVGNISGAGSTTVSGAGTSVTPSLIANDIDQASLTISDGAYVRLAPGSSSTSVLTALTVGSGLTPTANLDISDNDVVINAPSPAAGASTLSAVTASVNAGFAGGNGIVTNTFTTSLETVGFALNDFLGFTSFGGVTVNTDSVLIKYTYFGDSNLDGFVTDDDLGYFLAGYGTDVSANPWAFGDYNHDGFTTDDDLGFFLAAYGSTPGLSGGSIQAIPEPSTLVLGTLAGLGLGALSLRRRRAK